MRWPIVRAVAALAAASGCRLNFDAVRTSDAGDAVDGDVQRTPLACNTPVTIGAVGTGQWMSATTSSEGVVIAAWIAGGFVGSAAYRLGPADTLRTLAPDLSPFDGGWSFVSVAASGASIMVAVSSAVQTRPVLLDADLMLPTAAASNAIVMTGPRGLVTTSRATDPVFALAGVMGANTEMIGLKVDGQPVGAALPLGTSDVRTDLIPLDARIAVINSIAQVRCGLSSVDAAVTVRGTAVGWGIDGQCSQATGAHIPGSTDLLLVRHDTIDNDLNHVVGAITGTTFTVPGEGLLRTPANEARAVGVSDGYWVTYETAGTIEVVKVDLGGVVGTPVVLGPISDSTAHAVVVANDVAYAVWLDGSVKTARLCP